MIKRDIQVDLKISLYGFLVFTVQFKLRVYGKQEYYSGVITNNKQKFKVIMKLFGGNNMNNAELKKKISVLYDMKTAP